MRSKNYLYLLLLLFISFLIPKRSFSQIWFNAGLIYSSAPWKYEQGPNNKGREFENRILRLSCEIGYEYYVKDKISLSGHLSFYESGGRLVKHNPETGSYPFYWQMDKPTYKLPYIAIGNNVNYTLLKRDKLSLKTITGLRIDYLTKINELNKNYNSRKWDDSSPLQTLHNYGNIRALNFGLNLGCTMSYDVGNWDVGLELLLLTKFLPTVDRTNQNDTNIRSNFVVGVSENGIASRLTFGYKLKK